MSERDLGFGDEYGEMAGIIHDLAIWFERAGVACPRCGAFHSPHEIDCPIGRACEWRKLNASV